jgi:hypothetical protein
MLKGARQSKAIEPIAAIIKMGQIAPFLVFLALSLLIFLLPIAV